VEPEVDRLPLVAQHLALALDQELVVLAQEQPGQAPEVVGAPEVVAPAELAPAVAAEGQAAEVAVAQATVALAVVVGLLYTAMKINTAALKT
jgi:hypothetical protein